MPKVSCKFDYHFQRNTATAMILVKDTKLGTTRKASQQIKNVHIAIFNESMFRDKYDINTCVFASKQNPIMSG